jgi:hypothetical protein
MKAPAWNRFCSRPSGDGSARPIKKRRVWTKGHHNSLVPLQRIKIALPLFEEKACHIKERVPHKKMPFPNVRWKMVFAKPRLPQNRSAWQCLSQANRQFDFISFKRCSPVCGGDTFGDTAPCDKENRGQTFLEFPAALCRKVNDEVLSAVGAPLGSLFKWKGGGVRNNLRSQKKVVAARQSDRADFSFKEQQCRGMSAHDLGAAGQRTSIEVAFAPGAD